MSSPTTLIGHDFHRRPEKSIVKSFCWKNVTRPGRVKRSISEYQAQSGRLKGPEKEKVRQGAVHQACMRPMV